MDHVLSSLKIELRQKWILDIVDIMVRHWKPSPSYLDEVWWAKTKHLYGAALPAIPNTHPSCDLLMMLYITWNEWNHSILLSMSFLSGNVPKLFNVLSCLTCVRLRQKVILYVWNGPSSTIRHFLNSLGLYSSFSVLTWEKQSKIT